jgi:hypothetical protein
VSLSSALARYYRSEDDFLRLHRDLKLTPCPHCKAIGTLILNGKLYGFTANSAGKEVCRGKRVFCNNRKKRNKGCGKTFSIRSADILNRLCIGAKNLWAFIKGAINFDNKAQALRVLNVDLDSSFAYRIWKRFRDCQSHMRTALSRCCPPPALPSTSEDVAQTIAHLEAAFPDAPCPISAFQHQLQLSFL